MSMEDNLRAELDLDRPIEINIYGAGGGGKTGGGGSASSAPDTLFSTSTVKVLGLIGEGEIGGVVGGLKGVYRNDVAIQNSDNSFNFKGITAEFRTGTPDQSYMAGFPGVQTPKDVGVVVRQSTPVVSTLSDPTFDRVRVTLAVGALFLQKSDGSVRNNSVNYRIEIAYYNGPWVSQGDFTITGKNSSGYYRQHEFNLPKNPSGASAPWSIRVSRLSPDDDAANAANNKFTSQSTLTYFQITGLIDTKFTYPSSGLIGLSVTTSQLGDSIGEIRVLADGIKVPVPSNRVVNADRSRTYSGVWDGTFKEEICDNPIWLLNELVINDRFGLGQFVDAAGIDKASFYEISRYCDVLVADGAGGMEPRYTFNGVITNQTEAYDLLQMVAQVYRGMVYWSTGTITSTQDRPGDVKILVTEANVIDGELKYSSSSRKARHTVAMVSWHDPKNLYRENIEFVENAEGIALYGYNAVKIDMLGCTSRGQAYRAGLWTLYTELFETQIVNYKAGLDHAVVRPGDLIAVQDPQISNLDLSGRLWSGSTTTTLYLDHGITLKAGVTYALAVTLRDGTVQERAIQSSTTGSDGRTILTLATALTAVPDEAAVWQISGDIVPQKFRVISIKEDEPNIYSVTALEHEPSKFAAIDNGATFTETQFTEFPYVVLPPTNLSVREGTYTENQVPKQALTLSWTAGQPFNSVGYYVTIIKPSGDIVNLPRTASTSIDILDASVGTYRFLVTAIGLTGKVSLPTETTYVMAGWSGELGATVTGLATSAGGSTFGGRSVTVKWSHTFPTGRGAYTVRNVVRIFDASTNALLRTVVLPLGLTQYTYEYTDNVNDNGPRRQFRVSVTAQSPAGVEGNATSLLVSNPAPAAPGFSLTNQGLGYSVNVTDPGDSDLAGTIIFTSKTTPVALTAANARDIGYGFSSVFTGEPGDKWYVRVACYDAFDKTIANLNVAAEQSVTITSTAFDVGTPTIPGKPTISTSAIDTSLVDGNVTAYVVATWAASTGSFSDLYEYQLKLGSGNWGDIRGVSGNTVEVHGLLPSTGYTIRVRAVSTNRIKSSGWSPETTFTTAKSLVAPANPTGATVTGGFERALLNWTPSTSLDVRYVEVWAFVGNSTAATPASGSTIVYRAPADVTGYTDTIATTGTETYWLRAVSTSGVVATSYVLVGTATSAQIQKNQLVDKAVDASKIAQGLTLNEIIDDTATGLPTTGNYKGRQAYWQGKNYYYNGTKWVPVVTYGNAAGDKLTKDQLEQLQLADLGGNLTAPQIAGITGLTSVQISSVNVTSLTANAGQYLSKTLIDKLDLNQVSGLTSPTNPAKVDGSIIDRLRVTQLYGNTGDAIPKNLIATLDLTQVAGLASPTNPAKVDGTVIDRLRVTQLYGNTGDFISGTLIDNLSADKLNAGFLDMARLADSSLPQRVIAAGSILASKLILTDTTNLFMNPVFDGGSVDNWTPGTVAVAGSTAPSGASPTAFVGRRQMTTGTNDMAGTGYIPVTPGETYYMSADICATAGAVNVCNLYIRRFDGAKANGAPTGPTGVLTSGVPTTDWQTFSGQYTVPAGVYFIFAGIRVGANASAVADTYAYVTNFRLRKAASAELLVDGSITTRVLAAQSVTARTIAIADFQNLVNNGDFAQGINDGWHTVNSPTVTTSPPAGAPAKQAAVMTRVSTGPIITLGQASDTDTNLEYGVSCNAGDSYYYEAWVNQTASGACVVQFVNRAPGGSLVLAQSYAVGGPLNTWFKTSGVFTATVSGRGYFRTFNQSNNTTVYITQIRLQRRNAGQLVVDGTIVGNHVAANQITAKHLVLGDFENQISNGDFSQGLDGWATMAGVDLAGTGGVTLPSGSPSNAGVRLTRTTGDIVLAWNQGSNYDLTAGISCQTGDVYSYEFWAYSSVAGSTTIMFAVTYRDTANVQGYGGYTTSPTTIAANTWTKITGVWTSPVNGKFFPRLLNPNNNSTLHITSVRLQKKNAGQLIVDGSITTNLVAANAITASRLNITDTTNLLQNPDFSQGLLEDWYYGGVPTLSNAATGDLPAGAPSLQAIKMTIPSSNPSSVFANSGQAATFAGGGAPCAVGEEFYWEAYVYSSVAGTITGQGIFRDTANSAAGVTVTNGMVTVAANTWTRVYGNVAATRAGRATARISSNMTSSTLWVTNLRFQRRNAGQLIVDGAIIGRQIYGDTITGDKIRANAITAREMVLTDTQNLLLNGDWRQGILADWRLSTGMASNNSVVPSPGASPPAAMSVEFKTTATTDNIVSGSGDFPGTYCAAGEEFYWEAWVYADAAITSRQGYFQGLLYSAVNGSAGQQGLWWIESLPATTWTKLSGTTTVSASGRMTLNIASSANNTVRFLVTGVRLQRRNAAQLIVDGSIIANQIAANQISAKHLVLGDFQNQVTNGDFSQGLDGWVLGTGGIALAGTGGASLPAGSPSNTAVRLTRTTADIHLGWNSGSNFDAAAGIPCQTGDVYYIELWAYSTVAAATSFIFPVAIRNTSGSLSSAGAGPPIAQLNTTSLVANTWTKVTGTWTAFDNGKFFPRLLNQTNNSTLYVTAVRLQKKNAAALIVDGSIQANLLSVRSVQARHLVLTDTQNLLLNGDFSQGSDDWWTSAGTVNYVSSPAGGPSPMSVQIVRATGGASVNSGGGASYDYGTPTINTDSFYFEAWVYSTVAGAVQFQLITRNSNDTGFATASTNFQVPANTWTLASGTLSGPATPYGEARKATLRIVNTLDNSSLYATSARFLRKNAATLVVDGSIVGRQIAANEISATHLVLSDFQNLLMNGDFRFGKDSDWTYGGTVGVSVADVSGQSGAPAATALLFTAASTGYAQNGAPETTTPERQSGVPCNPGDQFYAEAWVRSSGAVTGGTIFLQGVQVSSTGTGSQAGLYRVPAMAANTWTKVSTIFSASVAGRMFLRVSPATQNSSVWFTSIRFQRMNAADLVVDGSIAARKLLVGGTVLSNILAPGEFLDRLAGWDKNESSQYQILTSGGPTGAPFLRLNRGVTDNTVTINTANIDYIPIGPQATLELGFWIKGSANTGTSGLRARLLFYNEAKTSVGTFDVFGAVESVTTAWTYKSGQASPPAGTRFVRVQFYHHSDSNIAILDIASITLRLQVGGTLIQDNGIVTGKIDTDAVEARNIKAESITAGKLLLTDTGNSVTNGDFFNGSLEGWTVSAGTAISESAATDQGGRWRLLSTATICGTSNYFSVNPGDVIYLSGMVFNRRAGEAYIRLEISDSNGGGPVGLNSVLRGTSDPSNPDKATTLATAVWTRVEGRFVIPAGYGRARVQLIAGSDGAQCYWGKIQARRAASAELIVDGSIVANKISANAVYARHIVANQIMASHLAVSSINIVPNGDYSQGALGATVSGSAIPGATIAALKNGGPGNLNAVRAAWTGSMASGTQGLLNQYDTSPSGVSSRFAVAASQYYEASVYVASSANMTARIDVIFYDSAGNTVLVLSGATVVPLTSIPGSTENSRRAFVFGTSPSNAATAYVRTVFTATAAVTNPYFIAAGYMMAPAQPGQTEVSPFVSPGLTTLDGASIRTGTVNANTIDTNTLTAATAFISVLGASILKAGVITADMVAVGLGTGNQLMNSDFEAGKTYWLFNGSQGGVGTSDVTPDSPQFGVSRHNLRGTSTSGQLQLFYRRPKGGTTPTGEPIPVFAGRRYELSAFYGINPTSAAWIYIQWLDASGNVVGTAVSANSGQTQTNGGAPGVLDAAHKGGSGGIYNGNRLGVIGVAPAGATQANLILRSIINDPNSAGSQTWFSCVYFGEVSQSVYDATTNPSGVKDGDYIFSPWAPMSVSIIDGGTLATGTVIADTVVAGSITSDSISITDKIKGEKVLINGATGLIETINLTATNKITAAKILLTGSQDLTSLLTGDKTEINGGAISTNSIRTESLKVGSRGMSVFGIEFYMPRDGNGDPTGVIRWTGGKILYIDDNGASATRTISANTSNNISPGGAAYYIFWQKGANSLTGVAESNTATLNSYLASPDWVIMATSNSSTGLIPMYGGSIIDGTKIAGLSIQAAQIAAGAINAGHISAISSSVVNSAVTALDAGKITTGTLTSSTNIDVGSARFRLSAVSRQLQISDDAGASRVVIGDFGGGVYGARFRAPNGAIILDTTGVGSVAAGAVSGTLATGNIPVLDTDKLADGAVTGVKSAFANGSNLLPNSDYERGSGCWGIRGGNISGATVLVDTGGNTLRGGHVLTVTGPAASMGTSGQSIDISCLGMAGSNIIGVPIEGGQRYEVSAWVSCRGSFSQGQIVYYTYNASGGGTGAETIGPVVTTTSGNRNQLSQYTRISFFFTAASTATNCVVGIRFTSNGGGALSYGSICRMFLAKARANQTEFSDWSGYTPQAKIAGSNVDDYMDSNDPIPGTYIASLTVDRLRTTDGSTTISAAGLSALSASLGTITAGKMQSVDGKMVVDLTNKFVSISD